MTDATPAVCVAAQQDSTGITSSVQAGLMRASTPRLDELAQMSLEALVAPEVGIASWRANTWTWRPGPARRVGLGFGSARIAADCAHEIGGRLHGTDRVDRIHALFGAFLPSVFMPEEGAFKTKLGRGLERRVQS